MIQLFKHMKEDLYDIYLSNKNVCSIQEINDFVKLKEMDQSYFKWKKGENHPSFM